MLTGRTRFRTGWLGKLILQVEYKYDVVHYNLDYHDCGGDDLSSTIRWRDAKISDLNISLLNGIGSDIKKIL